MEKGIIPPCLQGNPLHICRHTHQYLPYNPLVNPPGLSQAGFCLISGNQKCRKQLAGHAGLPLRLLLDSIDCVSMAEWICPLSEVYYSKLLHIV